MEQPDVPLQAAFPGKPQEQRGRLEQRCRGGVVVVRSRRRKTRAGAASRWLVPVLHVRRVIVIGHYNGLGAVAAGDHDQQIPFVTVPALVEAPAAVRGEIEIRPPGERQIAAHRPPFHPGSGYRSPVAIEEIVS